MKISLTVIMAMAITFISNAGDNKITYGFDGLGGSIKYEREIFENTSIFAGIHSEAFDYFYGRDTFLVGIKLRNRENFYISTSAATDISTSTRVRERKTEINDLKIGFEIKTSPISFYIEDAVIMHYFGDDRKIYGIIGAGIFLEF